MRTAQELAGHSTPILGMRYSHRRLHDLAGAVEKLQTFLPSLTNAKNLQKMRVFRRKTKAEGEGFEPSNTFVLPVFKTGAIGRSAIPPGTRIMRGFGQFF